MTDPNTLMAFIQNLSASLACATGASSLIHAKYKFGAIGIKYIFFIAGYTMSLVLTIRFWVPKSNFYLSLKH